MNGSVRTAMLVFGVMSILIVSNGCGKKKQKDALDKRLDTICSCLENKRKNCSEQISTLSKELREKKDLKSAKRAKARIKDCWSSSAAPSFSGMDPYRLTP